MKNKFITLLLIFTFIMMPKKINAEEQPSDYEHLLAGECVKSDGFFFSNSGMANLYLAIDEKIKLSVIDKHSELSKLKLDLKKCQDLKFVELKIQKEMYENQLSIKQQTIESYKNNIFWGNIRTVGYVLLGVGTGILLGTFIGK